MEDIGSDGKKDRDKNGYILEAGGNMERAGRLEVKDHGGKTENRVNTGQSLGTMRRRG
jgi:hypothetical protein